MKLITNIKEQFGQNVEVVNKKYEDLKTRLNEQLGKEQRSDKDITFLRGKMIRKMQQLYELTDDQTKKDELKQGIVEELTNHKEQIKNRLRSEKDLKNYSIAKEFDLKVKSSVASYKLASHSEGFSNKVKSSIKALGSTLSASGTLLKYPLKVGLVVLKKAAPLIISVGASTYGLKFLIDKINPINGFNGNIIEYIGKDLGNIFNRVKDDLLSNIQNNNAVIGRGGSF